MAEQISNQKVMDPSTFGLWGFAFATLLGNISALGAFCASSMLINNGIFLGGVAQFVTGMLCARRNNLAGLVTFGFFGLFWMIAGFEGLMGALGISHPGGGGAMGAYFAA